METTSGSPNSYKAEMTSNYWPKNMSVTRSTGFSNAGIKGADQTQYIMPFVRMNKEHRDNKNRTLYMNDSSHLNPGDPNSMRDQGQIRNAPYNIDTRGYSSTQDFIKVGVDPLSKTTNSTSWKGFPASVVDRTTTAYVSGNIKNRDVMNQSFYRFGGKTNITKQIDKFDGDEPKLNSTFNTILS